VPGQRRRHADHDHVALAKPGEIRRRLKAPFGNLCGQNRIAYRLDIAFARLYGGDLAGVGVKARDGKARLGCGHGHGQAHISQTDHPDTGLSGRDVLEKGRQGHDHSAMLAYRIEMGQFGGGVKDQGAVLDCGA
jgi:hypothetical protein